MSPSALLKLSPLRADPDFTFNLEDDEGVSDFFLDEIVSVLRDR